TASRPGSVNASTATTPGPATGPKPPKWPVDVSSSRSPRPSSGSLSARRERPGTCLSSYGHDGSSTPSDRLEGHPHMALITETVYTTVCDSCGAGWEDH